MAGPGRGHRWLAMCLPVSRTRRWLAGLRAAIATLMFNMCQTHLEHRPQDCRAVDQGFCRARSESRTRDLRITKVSRGFRRISFLAVYQGFCSGRVSVSPANSACFRPISWLKSWLVAAEGSVRTTFALVRFGIGPRPWFLRAALGPKSSGVAGANVVISSGRYRAFPCQSSGGRR